MRITIFTNPDNDVVFMQSRAIPDNVINELSEQGWYIRYWDTEGCPNILFSTKIKKSKEITKIE